MAVCSGVGSCCTSMSCRTVAVYILLYELSAAKQHFVYVIGLCLYPSGMPDDQTVVWWTP